MILFIFISPLMKLLEKEFTTFPPIICRKLFFFFRIFIPVSSCSKIFLLTFTIIIHNSFSKTHLFLNRNHSHSFFYIYANFIINFPIPDNLLYKLIFPLLFCTIIFFKAFFFCFFCEYTNSQPLGIIISA